MCDIYCPTCEEEGCETWLPVHIGDFRHPRESVHARCMNHPPPLDERNEAWGWEAFVAIEQSPSEDDGWVPLMFLKCDEVNSPSADDVCPNAAYYMAAVAVRPYDE